MTANTENYHAQGGDEWVVGGTLVIEGELKINGGTITNNGSQAAAIVSLTDSTTGTANNTVTDVGAAFTQATLNDNFADLTAKVNAILAALRGAGLIDT